VNRGPKLYRIACRYHSDKIRCQVLAVCLLALLPCATGAVAEEASAAAAHAWPDSVVARIEALALLQTLNAELLSHDSATATLERWCDSHRLASPPRVVAQRVPGAEQPPSAAQRRELGATMGEAVRYRHVKLMCGTVLLSEADNWYLPERLTPEMNRQLETTDTPFGRVVQALHFQRHTISAQLLWWPLPEGWEMNPAAAAPAAGELRPPAAVLQHRALLTLPDGTPFSEVVETYSGNVLAFPAPPATH
jgi:chorismate-pyruvate lyase